MRGSTVSVVVVIPMLVAVVSGCAEHGAAGAATDSRVPATTSRSTASTPPPTPRAARIDHVVDGDTVVVRLDGRRRTIRLIGIDTPETVKPDTPVQCFGPEASARTKYLLPRGSVVWLTGDARTGTYDRYGRMLAYLQPAGARITVNELLLREGYARLYVYDPSRRFSRHEPFARAERAAVRARRGLWRACPAEASRG